MLHVELLDALLALLRASVAQNTHPILDLEIDFLWCAELEQELRRLLASTNDQSVRGDLNRCLWSQFR